MASKSSSSAREWKIGGINGVGLARRQEPRPKVLPLRPDDPILHNNLDAALRDQGQLAEAVTTLRKAIGLGPEIARPYYHLGETLRRQGEAAQAITVLRQAVDLNPEELDAWTALASIYEAQGNTMEAQKAVDRVEALRQARQQAE